MEEEEEKEEEDEEEEEDAETHVSQNNQIDWSVECFLKLRY